MSKRMPIPFTGEFKRGKNIFKNAADTVNYYPERQGDGRMVLRGSPGLSEWLDLGIDIGIRGMIVADGFLYAVVGNRVYRINTAKAKTRMSGTSIDGNGPVSIAENSLQVMIVDPTTNNGFIVTLSSGVISKITDSDFPDADSVTMQDGFFIINRTDTAQFYTSDLNDGTSWPGLFTTAGWKTDNLVRMFSYQRDLYALGTLTVQPYYNNANTSGNFVYSILEGAEIEIGCAAWNSVAKGTSGMYFLGQDRNGSGRVFRIQGRAPAIVSDDEIADRIQGYTTLSDAIGFVYEQEGHEFYELIFPTEGDTLVFDAKEQLWHRKQSRITINGVPRQSRHRINNHVYFAGKHLVGDFENGKIYEMSRDYYDEDGTDMTAERLSQPLDNNQDLITVHELQVLYTPGQGLVTGNPEDIDPEAMISWSHDSGYTFSNEIQTPIGKIGEYQNRCVVYGLGQGRNWQFKSKISAAVRRDIDSAYIIGMVDNG